VVVDEVALEPLDLLVGQDDLGELADARVRPVHGLARRELCLAHRPAGTDALERGRVELDGLASPRDLDHPLDRERGPIQDDRHGGSFR